MEAVKREGGDAVLIAFLSNMRYPRCIGDMGYGIWHRPPWAYLTTLENRYMQRASEGTYAKVRFFPCGLVALWLSTTRTLGHSLHSQTW
jgi:hypothetical protein